MGHDNMVTCAYCGQIVSTDEAKVMPDGRTYCTSIHAVWDGWTVCETCGEWYRQAEGVEYLSRMPGNHRYCSEACAEAAGCERCDTCGRLVHPDEFLCCGRYRVAELVYCSDECAEAAGYQFHECGHCGEWHLEESMFVVHNAEWDEPAYYCNEEHARARGWRHCIVCGEWHRNRSGLPYRRVKPYCSDECAEAAGFVQCGYCGTYHLPEVMLTPDGEHYYCDIHHAELDGWRRCAQCGKWLNASAALHDSSGNFYCSEACAEAAGCERCEVCGNLVRRAVGPRIDGHVFCCSSCANRAGYYYCAQCGEWHNGDDSEYTNGFGDLCPACFDELVDEGLIRECDECGQWYDIEQMTYIERRDACICDDCRGALESMSYILPYSEKPKPVFHGIGARQYGFELETDTESGDEFERCELSRELYELDPWSSDFYQKSDCSLHNGIEIVTHPRTLASHVQYGWPRVLATVRDYGFRSHDVGTCGLHVHVSRPREYGYEYAERWGMRMWAIVENARAEFARFSRRTSSQLDHWARFDDDDAVDRVKAAPAGDKYDVWSSYTCGNKDDRYHAVNFCNRNTVEFRLFRGTLNYETLLATLTLVDGVARYAEAFSYEACTQCTFGRLVYWTACTCGSPKAARALVSYCRRRGLVQYSCSDPCSD